MNAIALEARSVRRLYGGMPLLDGVSLALQYGSLTRLEGVNGAGKTTLVNCLSGFDRSYSGTVAVDGRVIDHFSPDGRARVGVIRTFQTPHLFAALSVREHLILGWLARIRTIRGCFAQWRGATVSDDLVEELKLGSLLDRRCDALSYGEMKLVNVARALASGVRVLLLDEPLASLHPGRRELIIAAIERRVREGCAALVIEHDTSAFSGGKRVLLKNGQLERATA